MNDDTSFIVVMIIIAFFIILSKSMYYGTDGSFMDFIKEFLKNCIGIAGLSIVVLIPILFASLTENHEEEVAKIAGFILFFIVMPIIAGLAGLGFNSYD